MCLIIHPCVVPPNAIEIISFLMSLGRTCFLQTSDMKLERPCKTSSRLVRYRSTAGGRSVRPASTSKREFARSYSPMSRPLLTRYLMARQKWKADTPASSGGTPSLSSLWMQRGSSSGCTPVMPLQSLCFFPPTSAHSRSNTGIQPTLPLTLTMRLRMLSRTAKRS